MSWVKKIISKKVKQVYKRQEEIYGKKEKFIKAKYIIEILGNLPIKPSEAQKKEAYRKIYELIAECSLDQRLFIYLVVRNSINFEFHKKLNDLDEELKKIEKARRDFYKKRVEIEKKQDLNISIKIRPTAQNNTIEDNDNTYNQGYNIYIPYRIVPYLLDNNILTKEVCEDGKIIYQLNYISIKRYIEQGLARVEEQLKNNKKTNTEMRDVDIVYRRLFMNYNSSKDIEIESEYQEYLREKKLGYYDKTTDDTDGDADSLYYFDDFYEKEDFIDRMNEYEAECMIYEISMGLIEYCCKLDPNKYSDIYQSLIRISKKASELKEKLIYTENNR